MKEKSEAVAERTVTEQQWVPVQRVVFPGESDTSLWPLYVDWGVAPSSAALSASQGDEKALTLRQFEMPRGVDATRTSMLIPARERLSLATYFNAFPASYWQRWTDVRNIRLTLKLSKRAVVEVMRSSARGTFTPVATRAGSGELSFDIPLNRFGDGGWIWPEITALKEDVELEWGTWSVPSREGDRHANVTVGITTYNLPEDCLTQAERFQAEPDVLEHIAEILIVDQGNKNVKDCERYPRLQEELGSKLRVIEQANLGGSGGFSRGMYEMLKNPDSDYVLLLDDDAVIEPEGLLRALAFAEHTLTPTIVGGHMFNANERTILHSMGETIDAHKFWWGAVNPELATVDLAQRTIRNDPRLNRRIDVAYNGWWMCLIPKPVVAEIGLSLPFFIKTPNTVCVQQSTDSRRSLCPALPCGTCRGPKKTTVWIGRLTSTSATVGLQHCCTLPTRAVHPSRRLRWPRTFARYSRCSTTAPICAAKDSRMSCLALATCTRQCTPALPRHVQRQRNTPMHA